MQRSLSHVFVVGSFCLKCCWVLLFGGPSGKPQSDPIGTPPNIGGVNSPSVTFFLCHGVTKWKTVSGGESKSMSTVGYRDMKEISRISQYSEQRMP